MLIQLEILFKTDFQSLSFLSWGGGGNGSRLTHYAWMNPD